jgi:fido (protein-threonine AMPylation protein)
MAIREKSDPELFERIQEQNLLRQYDLLANCVEIGLEKGIEAFDKYTLWSLNYAAVANICQLGGRYRKQPIYVGNHLPPHFDTVDEHMDQFFSIIHENWDIMDGPTELAAFALWRLNWVHPFIEGNGRTARAACYYLMCLRYGDMIPGRTIVPELIRNDRTPYYSALKQADKAWSEGHFDQRDLDTYLQGLLLQQLSST